MGNLFILWSLLQLIQFCLFQKIVNPILACHVVHKQNKKAGELSKESQVIHYHSCAKTIYGFDSTTTTLRGLGVVITMLA